jgi:hypothetical protein
MIDLRFQIVMLMLLPWQFAIILATGFKKAPQI